MYSEDKWNFRIKRKGDPAMESKSSEKFENIPTGVPIEAAPSFFLTGESYQNNIDAILDPQKPVICKISIKEFNNNDEFKKLMHSVKDHTRIKNDDQTSDYQGEIDIFDNNKIRCLIIEDFNTTGIIGNPEIPHPTLPNGKPNNWYGFFHSVGKSPKKNQTGTGGSEGEGRQVFSYASKCSTFFVNTFQSDSQNQYFMGMCIMGSHYQHEKEYLPLSHFGRIKNENDPDESIDTPITNGDVKIYNDLFDINRDEYGTTIVIPFLKEEITKQYLITQSINRYRYAINNNNIELEICGEKINSNNIKDVIKEYDSEKSENLNKYLDFLNDVKDKNFSTYKANTSPNNQSLNIDNFNKDDISRIKTDYENNKIVNIEVPVVIQKKNEESMPSSFDIFIKKSDSFEGNDDLVRGSLPIYEQSVFRGKNSYGLCLISKNNLAALVRDAEGANHLKLFERAKLKENYEKGPTTIRLIKNSLKNVEKIILDNPDETDFSALKDFFPIEQEHKDLKKKKKPTTVIKVDSKPKIYNVARVRKDEKIGFRVYGNKDYQDKDNRLPLKLRIYICYDSENQTNPFRHYDQRDFDISKQQFIIERKGDCSIQKCDENRVVLDIGSTDFNFSIMGFSLKKRLKLKVQADAKKL